MLSFKKTHTILYVHSSDEMYGTDCILLELVKQLDKQQFQAIVVLPNDIPYQGLLSKALQEHNIKTIHLNLAILRRKYFTPLGFLVYLFRLSTSTVALVRLIQQESIQIVHSFTAAVIPGAIAAYITRQPHIWHVHEIIIHPRFLWRFTSWLIPRLSKQVVAVSEPTRKHLCTGNQLNEKKAIVIHNGIDISNCASVSQEVREEWQVRPEQPLVGMIGRVSHWKGQQYFLQVANIVKQKNPQVCFALVGGTFPGQEHLLEELKAFASQLNLSSSAIISNFRSDIPLVLEAYDIFVLPSTLPDPFPTVILEAMAAGKPVIANAHGGSVEMVVHQVTGLLVEPDSPELMANAIQQLLDNPDERVTMGKRGRERLISHFSIQSCVDKWTHLYESLISTTSPYN